MLTIRYEMTFAVSGCADLDAETDKLMEALLSMEASDSTITDSDVSCNFTTGELIVSVCLTDGGVDGANIKANSVIRSAIQSIGGATTEWPSEKSKSNAAEYEFRKQESLVA